MVGGCLQYSKYVPRITECLRAAIDSAGSVLKQNGLASNNLFYQKANIHAICHYIDNENKYTN